MIDYIEMGLRWIFGLQMVFWGLNGFFQWVEFPPSSPIIDQFVKACIDTRFIMPVVKVLEVVSGLLIATGILVPLNLAALAPILFVVTILHALHNPKPWGVLIGTSLPYALLLLFHADTLTIFF